MKKTQKKSLLFHRIWESRIAYLFIAPLMIGLLLFNYYPIISGLLHSLYDWNGSGDATFIGIQNFSELFKDKIFLDSIPTMFYLMIPKLVIGIIAPLVMSEFIYSIKSKKLQSVYRILILLPIVAPGVVGTLIWKNIYSTDGLMTAICRIFGIIDKTTTIKWFDEAHIIGSLIFMGFPWVGGTSVLIYLSGLMNISSEVIEATRLDGCSVMKRICVIDLPMLMGQIRYFLIFGIIGGLQDYSAQIVMTKGDPMVPGYYMYMLAFGFGKMGKACAIGTLLFILIMIITALFYKLSHIKAFGGDEA